MWQKHIRLFIPTSFYCNWNIVLLISYTLIQVISVFLTLHTQKRHNTAAVFYSNNILCSNVCLIKNFTHCWWPFTKFHAYVTSILNFCVLVSKNCYQLTRWVIRRISVPSRSPLWTVMTSVLVTGLTVKADPYSAHAYILCVCIDVNCPLPALKYPEVLCQRNSIDD